MMAEENTARGAALVERICTLSQTDPTISDSDFGVMVRRVGAAMAQGGENYLAAGADLAEFLLSDQPLGKGERRDLALLVLGAQRVAPHRPRTAHAANPLVQEVVDAFLAAMAEPGAVQKAVVQDICARFKITDRTLRNYTKEVRKTSIPLRRKKSH